MDETLLKRLVGVVALVLAAMLLTSILPKPGPAGLGGSAERVVTMDLTKADSVPVEVEPAAASAPTSTMDSEAPPPTPATPNDPVTTSPAPESPPPPAAAVQPAPAGEPPLAGAAAAEKPVPAPTHAEVTPPPVEIAIPAAAPSSANGKWQVQAGAYSQLERAESVRSKAAAVKVPCVISPADTGTGTLYRVRCGPYATRGQGLAAVGLLEKSGIKAQVVGAGR